jgi:cysteinyl-tRNA synthetase
MKIYDTLTGDVVSFDSKEKSISMYVCGITPYSSSHVGHAMSYVYFDTLRRFLEFSGYKVNHVQNFTDIDDKLIAVAIAEGVSVKEVADRKIAEYFDVMDRLNIARATVYPRATEEIPAIIELIDRLIEKGYAYAAGGDVYYRVRNFSNYGRLAKRTLDGMNAGVRIDPSAHKEYPMDFVLWKGAKPKEPFWESPWGDGRPGWHIECSAMSLKYLGSQIDIHGGGQDLIFPHHENEIAQSEAFSDHDPFVKCWMHNGLLEIHESKMSKSLGNLVTVNEALELSSSDAIRIFFLSSHYRSPLSYSAQGILAQEKAIDRIKGALSLTSEADSSSCFDGSEYFVKFCQAMQEDLNTPKAIGIMFDLVRGINKSRDEDIPMNNGQEHLRMMANILGLTLENNSRNVSALTEPLMELLIEIRKEMRTIKNYAMADHIRDSLTGIGFILEDNESGTDWHFKSS